MKIKNKNKIRIFANEFLQHLQEFLEESANQVNLGDHQEFSIDQLTYTLQKILGKTFLRENLEYINLYPINKYTETLHKFVVQTIKLQLRELNLMSNKFYEYYSSQITNNYQNYNNYDEDETINEHGIRQAYAILKHIAEVKNRVNDYHVSTYLDEKAMEINNKNFKCFNFSNQEIIETIKILIPSCEYFLKDKFKELKQYPAIKYNKELHEFILHIIKIELNRFKEANEEFYFCYTQSLNLNNVTYNHEDGLYEDNLNFKVINYYNDEGGINFKGINRAYLILHQLINFKNDIDFNN